MAEINAKSLPPASAYKLLTGLIVPRPIGWITSLSPQGLVNLAPFSAFALITHAPPMLMVSIGKREGEVKDTEANLASCGEFVVNVASRADVAAVHDSSADYAHDQSETAALDLELTPSRMVRVPRLARVRAAMECRVREKLQWADAASTVFIADVISFYIDDPLLDGDKVDSYALDPLGRIGGPNYASLGARMTMPPAQPRLNERGPS